MKPLVKVKKNLKKREGLTLIELLIVIAIIGLLASAALVWMQRYREQGEDAAIMAEMTQVRSAVEVFFIENNKSYEGVCDDDGTLSDTDKFEDLESSIVNKGDSLYCQDSQNRWAVIASLNFGDCWCVDSEGISKEITLSGSETCESILTGDICP